MNSHFMLTQAFFHSLLLRNTQEGWVGAAVAVQLAWKVLFPAGLLFSEVLSPKELSVPDYPSLPVQSSTGWMRQPYCGLCRPYSRSTRPRSSLSAMAEVSSSSSRNLSPFTSYLLPFQGFQRETDQVSPQIGSVTPPDSKGLQSRGGFPTYPMCLSLG